MGAKRERLLSGSARRHVSVRQAEFEVLNVIAGTRGRDEPDSPFLAEALPRASWDPDDKPALRNIARVVLVHRASDRRGAAAKAPCPSTDGLSSPTPVCQHSCIGGQSCPQRRHRAMNLVPRGDPSTGEARVSRRGLMLDPMLYPVWQMLPRAANLLQDWRSNRLLASNYDPGAGQRPDRHFLATALSEVPTPTNRLGVRSGGEGGTTPALAAVINAIVDALAELGEECRSRPRRSVPRPSSWLMRAWRNRQRPNASPNMMPT